MAQDGIGETLAGSPQPFLKSTSGWSRRVKALSEGKRYTPPGGHLKFPTASRNDNHPSFPSGSSSRPPFPSSRTDIGKRRVRFADTNQVSTIPTADQGNSTIAAAPLSNGPSPSPSPSPSPTTNNSRSRVHNSKHSTFGMKLIKSRKIKEQDSSSHNEKDDEQSQLRSLDIAAAAACRAAATAELARIQAGRAKLCQLRGEMQASISALEHEKTAIARKAEAIAYQNRKEKDEEIRRLRIERLALQRQGRLLTAAPAARAEKEKVAELQEALRNELSVKEAKEARYRLTIERIKKQLDEAHSRNAELADQIAALQRQQLEHLKAYPSSHNYNQHNTAAAAFFEREDTTTKQHHNMKPDQQQRNNQRPPPPLLSILTSNNNKHFSSSTTYKTIDRVQQQSSNNHSMEKSRKKPWNPVLTTTKGRTPAVSTSHHKYTPNSSTFQQHTNSNSSTTHQQQSLPNNNGHWTQYANGDIKRYYTDTGITEYLYSAVQCWQVTVPLSSPILLDNEDVATDHASSFARTYLTNNNNSHNNDDECPCIEVYYFSRGQVQANYPDGSKEILMPGTITLHYKVTRGQKTAATVGEMSSLVRRPMPSVSPSPD